MRRDPDAVGRAHHRHLPVGCRGYAAVIGDAHRHPDPIPVHDRGATLPAGALARSATVTMDGVRVRITLERNPMPAGERTRLTTTVTNVGKDLVTWFHDGCAISVNTWGEMADVAWRPGVSQSGMAHDFKAHVLDLAYRPGPRRVRSSTSSPRTGSRSDRWAAPTSAWAT